MSEPIKHDRRRFLGTAAMTLAAAQFGALRSVHTESGNAKPADVSPTKPGTNSSFGSLKQINAGVLNVGYAEAGPIDGPAVILLHGWPYDIHSYVDVAPLLASAGHRVIVPYLRGYGTTRFLSGKTALNGQQSVLAVDISRYFLPAPINIPPERHPFENKLVVAYPTKAEPFDRTDVYYRGFDQAFPDCWREAEWEREFDEFVKNNNLPSLSLVRLGSDHTGSFGTAIDEVNTPERQQADNDYAVGKLVEKIANSRYKTDTLIFILEDDAQSGEDHVDAHRSTAYVVGPYVKQGKVVSEFYTTVSMLRTIEEVLALEHLNHHTATARPMAEVFDLNQKDWNFHAEPSSYLADTKLPVPKKQGAFLRPTHDAAYWAERTKQFDFTKEDNLGDPEAFNRIIWAGLKGATEHPAERSGRNLRNNRTNNG